MLVSHVPAQGNTSAPARLEFLMLSLSKARALERDLRYSHLPQSATGEALIRDRVLVFGLTLTVQEHTEGRGLWAVIEVSISVLVGFVFVGGVLALSLPMYSRLASHS